MANLTTQVLADRAARDAAKATFDAHYGAFKADIAERGVTGRIVDETMETAQALFDEAVTVVEENPGAVGGTIAALLLWLLRNPIIAGLENLRGRLWKT